MSDRSVHRIDLSSIDEALERSREEPDLSNLTTDDPFYYDGFGSNLILHTSSPIRSFAPQIATPQAATDMLTAMAWDSADHSAFSDDSEGGEKSGTSITEVLREIEVATN